MEWIYRLTRLRRPGPTQPALTHTTRPARSPGPRPPDPVRGPLPAHGSRARTHHPTRARPGPDPDPTRTMARLTCFTARSGADLTRSDGLA